MTTPHKHAEIIHAFADGAKVQVKSKMTGEWQDQSWHNFDETCEYRIKPAAPVIYTQMTDEELIRVYDQSKSESGLWTSRIVAVANAAIAHAIADGQVVPVDQKNYVDRLAFLSDTPGMIEAARVKRDMAVAIEVKETVMNAWGRADRSQEYAAMDGVDLAAIIAGVK